MRVSKPINKLAVLFTVVLISFQFYCGDRKTSIFKYREIDSAHGKNLIADLDNDGRNDIITIGGKKESVIFYKSNADNSFSKSVLIQDIHIRGDRIETSDIDKDGDLDLVAGINESDQLFITWMRNPLISAEQKEWEVIKIGYQGTEKEGKTAYIKDIGVADFNGDGELDVVTRTNILTRLFFQKSSTEWSEPIKLSHHDHEGMDVGDLDGDGDPDIILNGFWYETPDDPLKDEFKQHVIDNKWFGQTEGTWRDDNASVKVTDVNGDGILDVLISHSEKPGYPISLYTASSHSDLKAGNWQETKIAEVFDFCQTLDADDIDNDGDVDVFAAKFERDHQGEQWRNEPPYPVAVFYNVDGKGLTWEKVILSEKGMYAGTLGDVGSDGDLDIVGPRSYWTGPTDMYENLLSDK